MTGLHAAFFSAYVANIITIMVIAIKVPHCLAIYWNDHRYMLYTLKQVTWLRV